MIASRLGWWLRGSTNMTGLTMADTVKQLSIWYTLYHSYAKMACFTVGCTKCSFTWCVGRGCLYESAPGYVDSHLPTHVCKLNKSSYGLKQAPRVWYHRLTHALLGLGFVCSSADSSLFIYCKDIVTIYCLVYEDDIIITRSTLYFSLNPSK